MSTVNSDKNSSEPLIRAVSEKTYLDIVVALNVAERLERADAARHMHNKNVEEAHYCLQRASNYATARRDFLRSRV